MLLHLNDGNVLSLVDFIVVLAHINYISFFQLSLLFSVHCIKVVHDEFMYSMSLYNNYKKCYGYRYYFP